MPPNRFQLLFMFFSVLEIDVADRFDGFGLKLLCDGQVLFELL